MAGITKKMYFCAVIFRVTRSLENVLPWWWNGRHEGLKIPCPLRACGFKSHLRYTSGSSSVGRAQPCQGWGREFESRFPLKVLQNNKNQQFTEVGC